MSCGAVLRHVPRGRAAGCMEKSVHAKRGVLAGMSSTECAPFPFYSSTWPRVGGTAGATESRVGRIRVSFDCDARNCALRRARRPSRISDRGNRFYLSFGMPARKNADRWRRGRIGGPTAGARWAACRESVAGATGQAGCRSVSRRTTAPDRRSRVRNRRAGTAGSHRRRVGADGSGRTRSRSASAWFRAARGRPSSSRS